jgi:hypothetical protein
MSNQKINVNTYLFRLTSGALVTLMQKIAHYVTWELVEVTFHSDASS